MRSPNKSRRAAVACVLSVVLLAAATRGWADDEKKPIPGKISQITCRSNDDYHYSVYLPSKYTPDQKWPVLYTHCPGGGGYTAFFRSVAEELGFIVIGLKESRNGPWVNIIKCQKAVWKDRGRLSIDPKRSYAYGFSGGSSASFQYALTHKKSFAGIIAVGGGGFWGLPVKVRTTRPRGIKHMLLYAICGSLDAGALKSIEPAAKIWKKAGKKVKFVTRRGVGHSNASKEGAAEALRWMEKQWLRSGKASRTRFQQVFDCWSGTIDRTLATRHRWQAYVPLRRFIKFFDKLRLPKTLSERLGEYKKKCEELIKDPAVAEQIKAAEAFKKISARVPWKRPTKPREKRRAKTRVKRVVKDLEKLIETHGDTDAAGKAERLIQKLKDDYDL